MNSFNPIPHLIMNHKPILLGLLFIVLLLTGLLLWQSQYLIEPANGTQPQGAKPNDLKHTLDTEEQEHAHSDEHKSAATTSPPEQEGEQAEHAPHALEIQLPAATLKQLGIQVKKAPVGSAHRVVSAPATVHFDADRVVQLGPRLAAKVVKITKDLGEQVQAGETVAILDSVALGKAKSRHLTTKARERTALAAYQRAQTLAKQQIASEAELLEARAHYLEAKAEHDAAHEELRLYGLSQQEIEGVTTGTKAPLSRYPLTTPQAGIVQQRKVTPGQSISPHKSPIQVVDTRQVWLMIDAFEQDLPRIRVGQSVDLKVRALPKQHFTGTVDWISQELDPETRTIQVRGVFNNPEGLLRAGMFGTAYIHTEVQETTAMVPVDAIQRVEGETVVFVPAEEPNTFKARQVKLGEEAGNQVEILHGLKPGEPVVMTGAFDLMSALTAKGRSAAHHH